MALFISFLVGLVLAIIAGIGYAIYLNNKQIRIDSQKAREQKEWYEKRTEGMKRLCEHQREDLVKKYGEPSMEYQIARNEVMLQLYFFNDHDIAVLRCQEVKISEIISCEIFGKTDTKTVSISRSTIDNKDMLKRAALGGLLLGSSGAIIGGATAGRNITTQSEIKTKTTYTVEVLTLQQKFTYHFGTLDGAKRLVYVINKAANLKSA